MGLSTNAELQAEIVCVLVVGEDLGMNACQQYAA